jgi:hypothetical protein
MIWKKYGFIATFGLAPSIDLRWWFGTYEGERKQCLDSRGEAAAFIYYM